VPKAVFLVPAQYDDAYQFLKVARHCREKHWGKANSVIFRAVWNGLPGTSPNFQVVDDVPAGFSSSFWHSLEAAEQFIPICHSGIADGPIIGPRGQQPWPTVPYNWPSVTDGYGEVLTEDAKSFWRRVSWAIGGDGKFLLAGCDSGKTYAKLVAKQVSLKVYGFKEHIGTGTIPVADKYIGGQFLHGATGNNVIRC
jgi:hypothetical protein